MYCSQWEKTSFSAVVAPAIDLNAQTMDCSIWLAFIRLVTKPRLSEQSAVCTRTQTCILSNRRNTFFDHHFRLAPLCGHDEYHQTISSRSGLYICLCVSSKNTAVCCLTARKSPRNSSLPLGLAIYILRKMPRKPDESSVECYGHGFLIAARPRGV